MSPQCQCDQLHLYAKSLTDASLWVGRSSRGIALTALHPGSFRPPCGLPETLSALPLRDNSGTVNSRADLREVVADTFNPSTQEAGASLVYRVVEARLIYKVNFRTDSQGYMEKP